MQPCRSNCGYLAAHSAECLILKTQADRHTVLKHKMFGLNSKNYSQAMEGLSPLTWSRFKGIWHATRNKLSLSGWLGVMVSLAVGIPALRYAYQSQILAYKSMKLAEWTAKKDFLDICLNMNV